MKNYFENIIFLSHFLNKIKLTLKFQILLFIIFKATIGFSQTFNIEKLKFEGVTAPKFIIDNNNNKHILYFAGDVLDGQLFYRNNIGLLDNDFNSPILIEKFGMVNYYDIEINQKGKPYIIYAYQSDEYNNIEDSYISKYIIKYAEIVNNSFINIDTIFDSEYPISGFKTKMDKLGRLHACFSIDSLNEENVDIFYYYDVLGKNKQLTPLSKSSYNYSSDILIDSLNFAHIFYKVHLKDENKYLLIHSIPFNKKEICDTIEIRNTNIDFKIAKGDNDIISMAYLLDSLYYLQINKDNSYSKYGLYSDPYVCNYWIQSFAVGDSTLIAIIGKYKDTLRFISTNQNTKIKSIDIPFFNYDFQKLTIDKNGYIYGLLYNTPDIDNIPIFALKSKIILDPLPALPQNPPKVNDTTICSKETLNINVSGVELKWYRDSLLSKRVYIGDSIEIDAINIGEYDYYVTETILNEESEPNKFRVTINPLPNISLGSDTIIALSDTIVLDAGANNNSYLWQDGFDKQSRIIIGSKLGEGKCEYIVNVTNAFSCSNSDTCMVEILKNMELTEGPNDKFIVYPNPSNGYIHIANNNYKKVLISVSDFTGKELYNSAIDTEVDLTFLKNGVYILRLNNLMIQKIIISK